MSAEKKSVHALNHVPIVVAPELYALASFRGPGDTITRNAMREAGVLTEADILKVEELNLSGKELTDVGDLKELRELRRLDLCINQISDVGPLKELEQLKFLHLSDNQISDVSPLKELKELTNLHLNGNQISDVSPLK